MVWDFGIGTGPEAVTKIVTPHTSCGDIGSIMCEGLLKEWQWGGPSNYVPLLCVR